MSMTMSCSGYRTAKILGQPMGGGSDSSATAGEDIARLQARKMSPRLAVQGKLVFTAPLELLGAFDSKPDMLLCKVSTPSLDYF